MQVVQLAAHGSHKPIVVADADELEAGGGRTPADTPRGARRPEDKPPAPWKPQLAIAATQASFVVGSVYLKSSLKYVDEERGEVFSPIVYALAREASAGPILLLLSWLIAGGTYPMRADLWRVLLLGFAMFLSQLLYILGIELSGVTVATCMQPAIPVFTVLMGIALNMEVNNPRKLAGISLAVLGAICMVAGGASSASHAKGVTSQQASNMLVGDVCLLINTLAMAVYYIVSKQMVQRYPAICVAAWAYVVAATCMSLAAAAFTTPADWHFPRAMVAPLIYWIIVCSVAGYYAVTWAMRHLPASQVAAFQCLQPFIGTLLAFLVLNEAPTPWDLGAVGIVAGLLLVTTDRRDIDTQAVVARIRRLLSQRTLAGVSKMLGTQAAALQRPGWLRTVQARRLRRPVRCFQDGDNASSQQGQGKATVRFSIPQQTRFGEHVAVVGSFSGWDTQAPVQLEWGEGSVWSGEAELPVGERLEYKYVVVSDRSGQVTWQPGGNLVLELGPGGGQTVLVLDDWLGRTHEVRPAAPPTAEPTAVPAATPAAEPAQPESAPQPAKAPAAQLERVAELELPTTAATEQPAEAVGLELPQVAAAEPADGVQAVEAAAEPEEKATPPERELPAEEAAEAPAVLAAEQHSYSNGTGEREPAVAAEVLAPAPAHPTAAESWRAVLETANQPHVAPPAAGVAATAAGNGTAAAGTGEPAEAVRVSKAVPASLDSTAGEAATQEPAAAVEESGAAASWRSVLQVANQPYVPPQPVAAMAASGGQTKREAAPAEEGSKDTAAAAVVAAAEEPVPAASAPEAVDAPAAAPLAKAAVEPAAQPFSNGSQPVAVPAKPEAAEHAAAKPAPAPVPAMAAAPRQQARAKGMAPWLRLLLAAALVVAAIIAFLKSPWAAARWALSAL